MDGHTLFKGKRFDVVGGEETLPDGRKAQRQFVNHPGSVVILPFVDARHILMIRNYRFAVQETLWELPAGTLDPGETPLHTAQRELTEETGYGASSIEPLTVFYSSPGISNERMYAFVAKDLSYLGQDLDDTEQITVETVSWSDVMRWVSDGTIHDAKTLVTLLYYGSGKGEGERGNYRSGI